MGPTTSGSETAMADVDVRRRYAKALGGPVEHTSGIFILHESREIFMCGKISPTSPDQGSPLISSSHRAHALQMAEALSCSFAKRIACSLPSERKKHDDDVCKGSSTMQSLGRPRQTLLAWSALSDLFTFEGSPMLL
jgi:hypothetical protein